MILKHKKVKKIFDGLIFLPMQHPSPIRLVCPVQVQKPDEFGLSGCLDHVAGFFVGFQAGRPGIVAGGELVPQRLSIVPWGCSGNLSGVLFFERGINFTAQPWTQTFIQPQRAHPACSGLLRAAWESWKPARCHGQHDGRFPEPGDSTNGPCRHSLDRKGARQKE